MNFLDVDVKQSVVTFQGQELGVASETGLTGNYRVGVRPEFVLPGGSDGVAMKVQRVENRGGFQLLKLGLGDQTIVSKVESDVAVAEGETHNFVLVPERTFLFEDKVKRATVAPAGKRR
jgi:ABC-type sugar transport system ATPase subunit